MKKITTLKVSTLWFSANLNSGIIKLCIIRPDLVEMLKKDKPELVKALDNLIDDMITYE